MTAAPPPRTICLVTVAVQKVVFRCPIPVTALSITAYRPVLDLQGPETGRRPFWGLALTAAPVLHSAVPPCHRGPQVCQ